MPSLAISASPHSPHHPYQCIASHTQPQLPPASPHTPSRSSFNPGHRSTDPIAASAIAAYPPAAAFVAAASVAAASVAAATVAPPPPPPPPSPGVFERELERGHRLNHHRV